MANFWHDSSYATASGQNLDNTTQSTFEVRWSTSPITNENYSQATQITPEWFGGVEYTGSNNLIRRIDSWVTKTTTQFELPDNIESNYNRIYFAIKDVSIAGAHAGTMYPWTRTDGHNAASPYIRTIDYNLRPDTTTTTSTPDTQPPTQPTNLVATTQSTSQITLTWSASTDNTGTAGYRVYRGTTLINTTTNTTYTDTNLSPQTSYTYKVQAYDAAGNTSTQSVSASATTQTQSTTPPPSTKFSTNDKIQTTSILNIRTTPNGTLLGTQPSGAIGTVVGGPTTAGGYTWWNVNYDTGYDGWSVEDWLTSYTAPQTQTCSSFTYSTWGTCQSNNTQTRTITHLHQQGV